MSQNFKIVWPDHNLKIIPGLSWNTYEWRVGRFRIARDSKMAGL